MPRGIAPIAVDSSAPASLRLREMPYSGHWPMLPIPRMPQTTDSSAFRSAAKVSVDLGEVEAMLDFIDKKTRSPAAASRARAELADALVTAVRKNKRVNFSNSN